ncbi:MAG: hypothetical protein ACE5KA_08130 [Nitrososphaerales archaeon]
MLNIKRLGLVAAVCFMGLSLFMIPVQADPIYAYIVADPVFVEEGESSTLTVNGFLYGSGTYEIDVEFWDEDKFEDIVTTDDKVGSCNTSVTVDTVGTFTRSFEVTPSDYMQGNQDEEADWVEYYALVSTKDIEDYNTRTVLVYCSWCNSEALGTKYGE